MSAARAFFTRSRNCAWSNWSLAGRRNAQLRQPVLVVVELVGIGLLGQRPCLAVMGPDLARPVIDVVPVHQIVERDDVAVGDVFGLVRLQIEDIRSLAGGQRRPERRVEPVLLVPGDLDMDAGMARLEIARRLLAERDLGRLIGLMAPDGQRRVLGFRRRRHRNGQRQRGGGDQQVSRSIHDCLLSPWLRHPGAAGGRIASAPLEPRVGGPVDWNKLK